MNRRERAAVVELLRCAADARADGIGLNGMFDAATALEATRVAQTFAWDALLTVTRNFSAPRNVVGLVDEPYRAEMLEAAARVEEGSWP